MPDISWNRQHWTASIQLHQMRGTDTLYGEPPQGTPETHAGLRAVLEGWVRPFLSRERTVLEIGTGGGRWTRHLLGVRRLYGVDLSAAMLAELQRRLGHAPALTPILTPDGTSLPGIPPASVDFAFSFEALTHLELDVVDAYLCALRPLLAPGADVVLHYANQDQAAARRRPDYGDADPRRMELLAGSRGYLVARHDTGLLPDSGLLHLRVWDGAPLPPPLPWPLQTAATLRVLVWPDFQDPAELSALLARFLPTLARHPRAALCVRHDTRLDPPEAVVIQHLQAAARTLSGDPLPEILLVEDTLLRSDLPRLGRAVQGVLALPSARSPGPRADFLQAVQAPLLSTPAEVERLTEA